MSLASRKKKTVSKPRYEDRIVLFLDFLGFSEIVGETESDEGKLRSLVAAMDRIKEIATDNSGVNKSQRLTHFSDSVVVSYEVSDPAAVFMLLNAVAFCVINLVERGYLVRGAIVSGKLYHTKNHIVGPAMIEAYRLESKVAVYPRILISEDLVEIAKGATAEHHDPDDEAGYVNDFMTADAEDGLFFFDYFGWQSVVGIVGGEDEMYPGYLLKISRLIETGLLHPEEKVREKYLWMRRHYLAAINLFEEMPMDDPYRVENEEICDAIIGLPRFDDLTE